MSMLDKPLPASYAYGDEMAKPMKTDANSVSWTGQPSPHQKRNQSNQANQLPRGWFDEDERRARHQQQQQQQQQPQEAQGEVRREGQKRETQPERVQNVPQTDTLNDLFFALEKNRYKQFDVCLAHSGKGSRLVSYCYPIPENMHSTCRTRMLRSFVCWIICSRRRWHKARNSTWRGYDGQKTHYSASPFPSQIVRAAVTAGDREFADQVIARAEVAGCDALKNARTHQRIMSTFAGVGDFKRVKRAHQCMRQTGATPNLVAYNIVLNCFASMPDEKRALSFLKTIKDDGFVPDKVSFNTAIHACSTYVRVGSSTTHIPLPRVP